jgi:hypothetical protein
VNGNVQGISRLLIGHPDELLQLDDFGWKRMLLGEIVQYLMHR